MVATTRITAAAQTFVYGHFRPRVSANTVQWAIGRCVFPRTKVPFTFGFGPPSNIPFHGRQKSTFQTASRSIHPFLQDARSWPRHTQIKLANSNFFSARQKTLSHVLSYCVVQSPATVAERRGVEQVAAVLTAKGRIAAATYRMTLAHAVSSLFLRCEPGDGDCPHSCLSPENSGFAL